MLNCAEIMNKTLKFQVWMILLTDGTLERSHKLNAALESFFAFMNWFNMSIQFKFFRKPFVANFALRCLHEMMPYVISYYVLLKSSCHKDYSYIASFFHELIPHVLSSHFFEKNFC